MSGEPMTSTGVTREGVRVEIRSQDDVRLNGIRMKVLRRDVLRDGGTTVYVTDRGTLTLPHRVGDPDRVPRWELST